MAAKKAKMVKIDANIEEIKKLQKFLAIEIQRAADLLKENQALEAELEKVKSKRDKLLLYWQKSKKKNKIGCDRVNAMIKYGDIDMDEVLGSK